MGIGTPEWRAKVARFQGSRAGRRGRNVFEAFGNSRYYPQYLRDWCGGYAQGRLELMLDVWWSGFKKNFLQEASYHDFMPKAREDSLDTVARALYAAQDLRTEVNAFLFNPMPYRHGPTGLPTRLAADRLACTALLVRFTFPDEPPSKIAQKIAEQKAAHEKAMLAKLMNAASHKAAQRYPGKMEMDGT